MKYSQGEGAKKIFPQLRLNFIDSKISAHCCVLNSPERLQMITQANEMKAIMGNLETDMISKNIYNKKKKKMKQLKRHRNRKRRNDRNSKRIKICIWSVRTQ